MITRRRFLVLAGVAGATAGTLALGVSALPGDDGPKSGPPRIRYGEDSCAHCRMVISDARFAAAWRDGNGREEVFDDIGCMVAYQREHHPDAATMYVHDIDDEGWLEANDATFVIAHAITTPMATGIAALRTSHAAKALADHHGGEMKTWHEVSESLPEGARHGNAHGN